MHKLYFTCDLLKSLSTIFDNILRTNLGLDSFWNKKEKVILQLFDNLISLVCCKKIDGFKLFFLGFGSAGCHPRSIHGGWRSGQGGYQSYPKAS